jgi:hypothetical protein
MDATNAFALDGSITMVWGFEDESDADAEAILEDARPSRSRRTKTNARPAVSHRAG